MNNQCDSCWCARKIRAFPLGFAIGTVSFFAVLIWTLYAIYYGLPPVMVEMHVPTPTLNGGFVHALLAFVKGFLFGFFIALLYNCYACCFSRRKSGSECGTEPGNKC